MTPKIGAAELRMDHAINAMAEILRQENAALEAMDIAAAGLLLAPKHAAADALAQAWRAAETDPALSASLLELGQLVEQNRLLLARAMRVQRRVLDLVARATKAGRNGPSARPARDIKPRT